jgi:hypothetical protein
MSLASLPWPAIIALLTTLLGGAGVGAILKAWLDYKTGKRKQTDEVAMQLVGQLQVRLTTVEAKAARDEALCEAQLAVQRHRINNLSSAFDGLLLVMELAPDRASEAVARIKARRVADAQAEATETAAVRAAEVAAAARVAEAPMVPPAGGEETK